MRWLIAIVLVGCSGNNLSGVGGVGDGGTCAAFRACYTRPDASFTNCEPGFSSLAIERAVALEDCRLIECLSEHGDAAPRSCENAQDRSPDCLRCLDNAEHGGPLGPCDRPSDPICGQCSAEVANCYGL